MERFKVEGAEFSQNQSLASELDFALGSRSVVDLVHVGEVPVERIVEEEAAPVLCQGLAQQPALQTVQSQGLHLEEELVGEQLRP